MLSNNIKQPKLHQADIFQQLDPHSHNVQKLKPRKRQLVKAIALSLSMAAPVAHAGIIQVNTSSDTATGQCRLRDAIVAANTDQVSQGCPAGSGDDVISFSGLTDSQITLSSPLPKITTNTKIYGANANQSKVTIDADGLERLLFIEPVGDELVEIKLRNLTLTGSQKVSGYTGLSAAVVAGNCNLELFDTTISGNSSGAVFSTLGTLEIFESIIHNNDYGVFTVGASVFIADSDIYDNRGNGVVGVGASTTDPNQITVADSVFSNNEGVGLGVIEANGSIDRSVLFGNERGLSVSNDIDGFMVTLRDSTVSHSSYGGIKARSVNLTIENSTLSGNTAHALSVEEESEVELRHTTVSDTTVGADQAAITFELGQQSSNTAEVTLTNSLVANTHGGVDCIIASENQKLILQGNNLMQSAGDCPFAGNGTVIENVDPLLGALSDNGGPTLTHLPSDISVVRDFGDNAYLPSSANDQRGTGFDRVFAGGVVDIGAVEIQSNSFDGPDYQVNTLSDSRDGECELAPGDCSLYEAISAANADPDASRVNFTRALTQAPGTITLSGTELPVVTTDIAIVGSGMEVDADGVSRVIAVDGGDLDVTNMIWTNGSVAAGGAGGAISVENGSFDLSGHSLIANSNAQDGGAIFASNAIVNVTDSTIAGNTAGFRGGAINATGGSTISVVNSTVSGNTGEIGGAILMETGTSLNLNQSTVASNTANNAAVFLQAATANISNSLIANSSLYDCTAPTGSQVTISGGNLVEFDNPNNGCTANNVIAADPMLGNLVDSGLARGVHLPALQSPVLNAGDNAFSPGDFDQAGNARILDATVDIGAIETNFRGELSIIPLNYTVDESGGSYLFNILRVGGNTGAVAVTVNTVNGTAVAGQDFQAITDQRFVFDDGDTMAKQFSVVIIDDDLEESDEEFSIQLSNPEGGAILGEDTATFNINANDVVTPVEELIFENGFEIPD